MGKSALWTALLALSACNAILGIGDVTSRGQVDAPPGTADAPPGCGDHLIGAGEQCDDGAMNGTPGDHCSATCQSARVITAKWTIENVAGAQLVCPVGYTKASLHAVLLDANGVPVGPCEGPTATCVVTDFACADGVGESVGAAPGHYRAWLEILDDKGLDAFAVSLSYDLDLTQTDQTFRTKILTDGGWAHITWTLTGAQSGQLLSCADAGVAGVELISTVSGTSNSNVDQFSCTDGSGYAMLAAGKYVWSSDAFNSANQAVANAPSITGTMPDHNAQLELGVQAFSIMGK